MSGVVSPVSGKPYGLAAVCRAWGVSPASVYRRQRLPPRAEPRRRPGPVGGLTDAALLVEIRRVLAASRFHGEGYRKIWARLRVGGVRGGKGKRIGIRPSLFPQTPLIQSPISLILS